MQPNNSKEVNADTFIIQEKITKSNHQTVIKKYSRGKTLGRGGFAKCYQVTNLETNRVLAAKIIAKSTLNRSRAKQKLITEIKIHKSLDHMHVVKFEHVFEDSENVYILLELCSNNTLNQLLKRRKRLTEPEVQYYLSQIVGALKYLHQNKVIHRDLKLGNLFLNENMQIKLGDFGLATRLEFYDEKKKTVCGTPNYIAPEILEGKGHTYEVDVWSIGVIIYTQLIGRPPFETPEVKATYRKIKACNYGFPESVTISDNARNLISKILVLDPSQRPTLDEIMSDPFMTSSTIPTSMPRSTLACPPNKSTMDSIIGKQKQQYPQRRTAEHGPESASLRRESSKDLKQSNRITAKETTSPLKKEGNIQQVHVKKWVDYSTKYGLGYLLTDGSTGVYFNDSTKIIMDQNQEDFHYIERNPTEKGQKITDYKKSTYPSDVRELQKKVTLLTHFKNYLYSDFKNQSDKTAPPNEHYTYVKKWMKTKHAIMFRLSNKIVQVNFTDKTEIILSSQQKLVTYIDLKGQVSEYQLSTALDSRNTQMAKRLKYTKQILTHMLNGVTGPTRTLGNDF